MASLQVVLDAQKSALELDSDGIGLGGPIYDMIFDFISEGGAPKAGVKETVWHWVRGAKSVNAGEGFYADYIRDYTMRQFELRGGECRISKNIQSNRF